MTAANGTSPFPIDDHRRAACVELLVFYHRCDQQIQTEPRNLYSPLDGIRAAGFRAGPLIEYSDCEIVLDEMCAGPVEINIGSVGKLRRVSIRAPNMVDDDVGSIRQLKA